MILNNLSHNKYLINDSVKIKSLIVILNKLCK